MKKTRRTKNNDLRVEIQRLREELRKAKSEAATYVEGAAEVIKLTEAFMVAAMKACGLNEIEVIPCLDAKVDPDDRLMMEKTEKGFIVRLARPGETENDKNPEAEGA